MSRCRKCATWAEVRSNGAPIQGAPNGNILIGIAEDLRQFSPATPHRYSKGSRLRLTL
jgi:hypothetical protein